MVLMAFRKILAPIVISAFFLSQLAAGADIVRLTDANFEHETQATTGSTTGSWLILFEAKGCKHCKAAMPHFKQLSEDEDLQELGVVLATVNVPSNRKTTSRFEIRGSPTVIFLHKGRTYFYRGKREFEPLKDFASGGYQELDGIPTPQPPTPVQEAITMLKIVSMELYDAARGKHGTAGVGVVVMVGVVICFILLLISICFLPARKLNKDKAS